MASLVGLACRCRLLLVLIVAVSAVAIGFELLLFQNVVISIEGAPMSRRIVCWGC
jgi:hypothetical protein